jgi:hypothetical protein
MPYQIFIDAKTASPSDSPSMIIPRTCDGRERLQVGKQMAEICQKGIVIGNNLVDHVIQSFFQYCRPVIASPTCLGSGVVICQCFFFLGSAYRCAVDAALHGSVFLSNEVGEIIRGGLAQMKLSLDQKIMVSLLLFLVICLLVFWVLLEKPVQMPDVQTLRTCNQFAMRQCKGISRVAAPAKAQ